MRMLKIALAQCHQTDDFDSNAEVIFRFLEEAGRQQVQVICFPEAQTVGYRVDVVAADAPVPVEKLDELHAKVAQRCAELGMGCVLGTEIANEDGGKPFNSALVISEHGEIIGAHHKSRLTPFDAVAYSPGITMETFVLFGVKIGVVICYEGFRFAETTEECVRQGAQLIFHPQNNATRPRAWKIPVHQAMITTRAAENTVWVATCNCCHIPHQNCRSMVISPDGQVHAQTELTQDTLLVDDIDIDKATRAMFLHDQDGCAEILCGDRTRLDEYEAVRRR